MVEIKVSLNRTEFHINEEKRRKDKHAKNTLLEENKMVFVLFTHIKYRIRYINLIVI